LRGGASRGYRRVGDGVFRIAVGIPKALTFIPLTV